MGVPSINTVGVVALVPDSWDDHWQTRHHVLSRLSRYFTVVWMDPPLHWREVMSAHAWRGRGVKRPLDSNAFIVYRPEPWRPNLYRPAWAREAAFLARLRRARAVLSGLGCGKFILYLWRPEFAPAMQAGGFDLRCYHIDDEYSFSDAEVPPDPAETNLIARADQVFIHSRRLLRRKAGHHPHAALIPNGVDYDAYARSVPDPADLAGIPHPRIGYTGFLKRQLDWEILTRLAGERPDWSFVFVGPPAPHHEVKTAMTELRRFPNVHFLGGKSVGELAKYPQHFDACLMPYRNNEYTRNIYPLKLHEYLAGGRPVIGTRLPSLEEFSGIVSLAESPEEWSSAVEDALKLEENAEERRRARQAEAERHDWGILVHRIAEKLAARIGTSVGPPPGRDKNPAPEKLEARN